MNFYAPDFYITLARKLVLLDFGQKGLIFKRIPPVPSFFYGFSRQLTIIFGGYVQSLNPPFQTGKSIFRFIISSYLKMTARSIRKHIDKVSLFI